MSIPQATLDTINKALEAEGLSGQLEPPVTPTEDIQKSLARHADKAAVWYVDASLVTPAAKRNIMKALGSLGAAVTAYGVLVPTPTDAAAGDEINNSRDGVSPEPAADDPEAEGEAVDASPEAKPYPTLADVPRRIEPEADELTHEQYLDSEHAMMEAALDEGGEAKAVSTPTPKADPKLPVGIPDVEIPAVADAPPDHTANAQPATPRKDAEPARPLYHTASPHFYNSVAVQVRRKQSSIEIGIRPTELDKLLNDRDVEILHMWGDGANFNVVYWRWVD